MYQMKNFQTSADLTKNYYSFFNITRNFDGSNATFSYLINVPFQQIDMQNYCILYITYCKQYFHLAGNFFPVSYVPRKENIFAALNLSFNNTVQRGWFISSATIKKEHYLPCVLQALVAVQIELMPLGSCSNASPLTGAGQSLGLFLCI